MALQLVYAAATGQYEKAFKAINAPIAKAVLTAFKETAAAIVKRGRSDISAGGFTARFTRGYKATVKPTRNVSSLTADEFSITTKERFGFLAIFENGGTIKGRPFLWLPLPGVPEKIGGKRMTPALFVKNIGPLVRVNRPGKPPLLLGPARGVRKGRVGIAALRRGAAGGGDHVPIFVGVRQVHLTKRIQVNEIVADEAAKILVRYETAFTDTP